MVKTVIGQECRTLRAHGFSFSLGRVGLSSRGFDCRNGEQRLLGVTDFLHHAKSVGNAKATPLQARVSQGGERCVGRERTLDELRASTTAGLADAIYLRRTSE